MPGVKVDSWRIVLNFFKTNLSGLQLQKLKMAKTEHRYQDYSLCYLRVYMWKTKTMWANLDIKTIYSEVLKILVCGYIKWPKIVMIEYLKCFNSIYEDIFMS